MTLTYTLVIAVLAGAGIYMALARNVVRMILGLALLAASANLLIFLSGRLTAVEPPIIPQGGEALLLETAANPLPQALVLTAIVIGFALTTFAALLAVKTYKSLGTLDARAMTDAEAMGSPFAAARPGETTTQ